MCAYFNIIKWDEITESPICSSMALSHSYEHSYVDVKVTLDFCTASRDYDMKAKPTPVVSAHLEMTRVLVFSARAKLYIGVVWLSSVFIVSHSRVNEMFLCLFLCKSTIASSLKIHHVYFTLCDYVVISWSFDKIQVFILWTHLLCLLVCLVMFHCEIRQVIINYS